MSEIFTQISSKSSPPQSIVAEAMKKEQPLSESIILRLQNGNLNLPYIVYVHNIYILSANLCRAIRETIKIKGTDGAENRERSQKEWDLKWIETDSKEI